MDIRSDVDEETENQFEKHATKSHLPKFISRAGRSDISGPHRVSEQSNTEQGFLECITQVEF